MWGMLFFFVNFIVTIWNKISAKTFLQPSPGAVLSNHDYLKSVSGEFAKNATFFLSFNFLQATLTDIGLDFVAALAGAA